MSLSTIVDALVDTVEQYGQVRCTSDMSSFTPPCVIVDAPESIDFQRDYTGRAYMFPLLCVVATKELRGARTAMHDLIDATVDAIEDHHTLDGVVDSAAPVNSPAWQVRILQDVECLVATVRVEVLA